MMTSKSFLKDLRTQFREGVYHRDQYKCKICGQSESINCHLDAHHITDRHEMPNDGYVLSNGITLCPKHHLKAEVYHQTHHYNCVAGFSPDELYTLIGSSYQQAYQDCLSIKKFKLN